VDADPAFFTEYLATIDCSEIEVYAMKEGGVVFPRLPLIRWVEVHWRSGAFGAEDCSQVRRSAGRLSVA
jgi:hypothetical protein